MEGIFGKCMLLLPQRRSFHSSCHCLITALSHSCLLSYARTEHKSPPSPGEFLFSCLSSSWRQSGWSLFFYNKVMAIAFFLFFSTVRIKIENICIVPRFVSDTVLNLFKHYFS